MKEIRISLDDRYMRPPLNGSVSGLIDLCGWVTVYDRPSSELTMVEIGPHTGESTEIFAQYFKEVTVVDIWQAPDLEPRFDARIMGRFNNVKKIKDFSHKASSQFEDQSIDFVYIDAEHTVDNVDLDIKSWLPKIRGKFIAGHDYHIGANIGVVHGVFINFGFPMYIFNDSSWIVKIKREDDNL